MKYGSQLSESFDRGVGTRAFVLCEDDLFATNSALFVDLIDLDIHRHDLVLEPAFGDRGESFAMRIV